MPKFSIIIPVYNVAPYLRECLDSVLAQTFADWEAICVDDGSTDGSGAILDEYASRDSRFRVIHQSNRGVSAARNAALDVAQGEWIGFVDADDIWHRDFLVEIIRAIPQHPECRLFRHGFVRYRDGAVCNMGDEAAVFRERDISKAIAFSDFYGHYFWGYVYHRDVIGNLRFPCYRRGEDRVFLGAILLNHCRQLVFSEVSRYGYRIRPGSAMNSRPSVQVLKDELSHRVDVIAAIDASGKKVPYRKTDWLELYCTREYQRLVRDYSVDERQVLMSWFYHELPRIRSAKGFSWRARFDCFLYIFCRGRFGWWLVSWLLPITMHRVKVLIIDFPHAVMAIKRRFGRMVRI